MVGLQRELEEQRERSFHRIAELSAALHYEADGESIGLRSNAGYAAARASLATEGVASDTVERASADLRREQEMERERVSRLQEAQYDALDLEEGDSIRILTNAEYPAERAALATEDVAGNAVARAGPTTATTGAEAGDAGLEDVEEFLSISADVVAVEQGGVAGRHAMIIRSAEALSAQAARLVEQLAGGTGRRSVVESPSPSGATGSLRQQPRIAAGPAAQSALGTTATSDAYLGSFHDSHPDRGSLWNIGAAGASTFSGFVDGEKSLAAVFPVGAQPGDGLPAVSPVYSPSVHSPSSLHGEEEFKAGALRGARAIEERVLSSKKVLNVLAQSGIAVGQTHTKPSLVDLEINERFILGVIRGGVKRHHNLARAFGLLNPKTCHDAMVFISRWIFALMSRGDGGPSSSTTRAPGTAARPNRRAATAEPELRAAKSESLLGEEHSSHAATPPPQAAPSTGLRRGARERRALHSNLRESALDGSLRVHGVDETQVLEDTLYSDDEINVDALQCWFCDSPDHVQRECDKFNDARATLGLPPRTFAPPKQRWPPSTRAYPTQAAPRRRPDASPTPARTVRDVRALQVSSEPSSSDLFAGGEVTLEQDRRVAFRESEDFRSSDHRDSTSSPSAGEGVAAPGASAPLDSSQALETALDRQLAAGMRKMNETMEQRLSAGMHTVTDALTRLGASLQQHQALNRTYAPPDEGNSRPSRGGRGGRTADTRVYCPNCRTTRTMAHDQARCAARRVPATDAEHARQVGMGRGGGRGGGKGRGGGNHPPGGVVPSPQDVRAVDQSAFSMTVDDTEENPIGEVLAVAASVHAVRAHRSAVRPGQARAHARRAVASLIAERNAGPTSVAPASVTSVAVEGRVRDGVTVLADAVSHAAACFPIGAAAKDEELVHRVAPPPPPIALAARIVQAIQRADVHYAREQEWQACATETHSGPSRMSRPRATTMRCAVTLVGPLGDKVSLNVLIDGGAEVTVIARDRVPRSCHVQLTSVNLTGAFEGKDGQCGLTRFEVENEGVRYPMAHAFTTDRLSGYDGIFGIDWLRRAYVRVQYAPSPQDEFLSALGVDPETHELKRVDWKYGYYKGCDANTCPAKVDAVEADLPSGAMPGPDQPAHEEARALKKERSAMLPTAQTAPSSAGPFKAGEEDEEESGLLRGVPRAKINALLADAAEKLAASRAHAEASPTERP